MLSYLINPLEISPGVSKVTTLYTTRVNYTAYGGGGGGGGSDGSYSGGNGLNGTMVIGSIVLNPGETLYCIPGGGGEGGASKVNSASIARGGSAYIGYSGGDGGKGGTYGSSGYGGGGGGATVILIKRVNGSTQLVCVAAGGGGGGGAGRLSTAYSKYSSPTFGVYGAVSTYDNFDLKVVTNSSWSSFMNSYGVAIAYRDETLPGTTYTFTRKFYVPVSATYSCSLSADNMASMYIDNLYIGTSSSYTSTSTFSAFLTEGWHYVMIAHHNAYHNGRKTASGFASRIYSTSNSVWDSRTFLSNNVTGSEIKLGRGGTGQSHILVEDRDGGGAGGGGGGFTGGIGGSIVAGDRGAYNGSSGYSYSNDQDAYILPNPLSPPSTSAFGGAGGTSSGANGTNGRPGSITLDSIGTKNIYNKRSIFFGLNSVMRSAGEVYYRNSNAWTTVQEVYVKHDGQWIRVFGESPLSITSTSDYATEQASNSPVIFTLDYDRQYGYQYNYGDTGVYASDFNGFSGSIAVSTQGVVGYGGGGDTSIGVDSNASDGAIGSGGNGVDGNDGPNSGGGSDN